MTPDNPERHQHTPAEERKIREAALDETLEGSFPASDPLSSNPNPDDHDAVKPDTGRDAAPTSSAHAPMLDVSEASHSAQERGTPRGSHAAPLDATSAGASRVPRI